MKTTKAGKMKIIKPKQIDLNNDDPNAEMFQKTKKTKKKKKKKKRAASQSLSSEKVNKGLNSTKNISPTR